MSNELSFFGYPLSPYDRNAMVAFFTGERRPTGRFHLVNAYNMALAHSDKTLAHVYGTSEFVILDGASTAAAGRLLGQQAHHVRGPELFRRCIDEGRESGTRHFLLGGDSVSAKALQSQIELRFPGAQIVGTLAPPFKEFDAGDIEAMRNAIEVAKPHIVWLGLGTPKQDHVAAALDSIPAAFITVGAAFDFLAGVKNEAPILAIRFRLEWLHRLLSEPGRLWRRYASALPTFAYMTAKEFLRVRTRHPQAVTNK